MTKRFTLIMDRDCEWYKSAPDERKHGDFLKAVATLLLKDAVFSGTQRSEPVIRWREPEELKKVLKMELQDEPVSQDVLLEAINAAVKFSAKPGHPMFLNQLYSGLDPYGLAGQWATDALNPSSYTYEVAPVFTVMEEVVLQSMRGLVGFPGGAGDGVFCPGGSLANGYAINLARYKAFPSVKTDGLHSLPRLVMFASEDAHYSVHKMAALQGLGERGVRSVRCDAEGRMDVAALEESIKAARAEGAAPFLVFATAGTTVLGAIDPLSSLADVCSRHGLWLHVDAAWGGGLLFSRQHKNLLNGIQRADSVAWNPHKLLAAPQQCSVLLVRHEGLLASCHARHAPYLFQKDKFYDSKLDPGDKYMQCGRRVDVFKFWLMWKAKGSLGFEKHVDWLMQLSLDLVAELRRRSDRFHLVLEAPTFINVGFWFVPPRLRGKEHSADFKQQLNSVAPRLKEAMIRKGSMMLNYQPLRDWPNFFRYVAQSSSVSRDDLNFMLDELERLGADL